MTDQPADYATATIRGVLTDLQRIAGEPAQASEIERLASVLDSLSTELAEAASALRSLT